jgi:2-keto-4-pentenoate hydratase/2-oxohepta-3-ene-1,7-dioic acid hydratase in catechol pathway
MKLATFTQGGRTRIGLVEGREIADVGAAAELPRDMVGLLRLGAEGVRRAAAALPVAPRIPLAEARLEPPVPNPPKFLAVGLNYEDHVREVGAKRPDFPSCFAKLSNAINGPYDPVQRPRISAALDYEGELGVVIGRRGRHIAKADAPAHVAGYCCVNDVSVRDWQKLSPQVVLAKNFDSHAPFGPWIVTPDEVGDPHALRIRTLVNGEVRQDSNTKEMIFNCFDLIEIISRAMTLEPGDVISTGTPPGVALGMKEPRWLKVGDVVRVEIEKLGHIENRIVEEPRG